MKKLLHKELRLTAAPITYLFLAFALMPLIPGYPILMGGFFITLGIFYTFQMARESGDILFTALLPCGSGEALNLNPSLLTDFLRTQGAAPVWQCRVVRTHLYNKAGKDFE